MRLMRWSPVVRLVLGGVALQWLAGNVVDLVIRDAGDLLYAARRYSSAAVAYRASQRFNAWRGRQLAGL